MRNPIQTDMNNLNELIQQVKFIDLKNGRWVCTSSLSLAGPVLRAYGDSPEDALRNLVEIWSAFAAGEPS